MEDSGMTQIARRRLRTGPAAEYVGLSERTLEKLRVIGGGPRYAKLGRAVVYDTADLDRWVEERQRTSTSEPLVA
jgi:predicted DNA-binding transcriptional regulator AlpA